MPRQDCETSQQDVVFDHHSQSDQNFRNTSSTSVGVSGVRRDNGEAKGRKGGAAANPEQRRRRRGRRPAGGKSIKKGLPGKLILC